MSPINYYIHYSSGKPGASDFKEIKFTDPDSLKARKLAVDELKQILEIAALQLKGEAPDNKYEIVEWDTPSFIDNMPELNGILSAFSIGLYFELDGMEYSLYGESRKDTLEALSVEADELKKRGLLKDSDVLSVLENLDYIENNPSLGPLFLFAKDQTEVPEFRFSQYDIIKSELEFLLGYK